MTIKDDNYKINFGLIGANGVKGITVINPQGVDSSTTKLEQLTIVKKNVSSVIYEDILTDVDLQCTTARQRSSRTIRIGLLALLHEKTKALAQDTSFERCM